MTYQTTTRVNRSPTATSPSRGWLTAVLRPAGTLDNASTAALGALLADLSAAADMVVVDSTPPASPTWPRSSMRSVPRRPASPAPAPACSSSTRQARWSTPSRLSTSPPRPWPPTPSSHRPRHTGTGQRRPTPPEAKLRRAVRPWLGRRDARRSRGEVRWRDDGDLPGSQPPDPGVLHSDS
jgi:hypothetical protein